MKQVRKKSQNSQTQNAQKSAMQSKQGVFSFQAMKMRARRAFSLFTPLVGTAIMVITIIMSSTIIQNDVRFSNAITTSYIVSSQTIVSRGIEADIISLVKRNMYNALTEGLTVKPFSMRCQTGSECITESREALQVDIFSTFAGKFKLTFFNGMDEVLDVAKEIYNYDSNWGSQQTVMMSRVQAISERDLATTTVFDPDGYYVIGLNSQYLLEHYREDFSLTFKNEMSGERFRIPIIPEELEISSDLPIEGALQDTAAYFDDAKYNPTPVFNSSGPWLSAGFARYGVEWRVTTEWRYGTGKFVIIFKSGDIPAQIGNTVQYP